MLVFLIRDVIIKSPPGPSVILSRNSKLQRKFSSQKQTLKSVWLYVSQLMHSLYQTLQVKSKVHLWGQIFRSSSEGLRIKSTKALLAELVGKGGGSESMLQTLFLAKPCWSREPWLENCVYKRECLIKFEIDAKQAII